MAAGFAASLAKPGGRATGVSVLSVELYPKRLELLRELAPHARRIVFLRNPTNRLASRLLNALQTAGQTLGLQIKTLDARDDSEVNTALHSLRRSPPDALIVSAEPLFLGNKAQIARAVRTYKLPAVFPWGEYHDEGVLMCSRAALRSIRVICWIDRTPYRLYSLPSVAMSLGSNGPWRSSAVG